MKNDLRPFDMLEKMLGKMVTATLKTGSVTGVLRAWDLHLNLWLADGTKDVFVRGENVVTLMPEEN